MNITPFDIWIIQVIGLLRTGLVILNLTAFFSSLALAVLLFPTLTCGQEEMHKHLKRYLTVSILSSVILSCLVLFVPSSKTLIAMRVIPALSNSDTTKALFSELPEHVIKQTKNWITED